NGAREHLYDAFDQSEDRPDKTDLLDQLDFRITRNSAEDTIDVHSLLASLYQRVKESFTLPQQEAFKTVRQYFTARGLPIGHGEIKRLLLASRPIELTELVKETGAIRVGDIGEEIEPYRPIMKSTILLRPESIDAAIKERYGEFDSDDVQPGNLFSIVKAVCSAYFSGTIPASMIEKEFDAYRFDRRKKVENNPWKTRTVRILSEALILKHGLVDDISNIPDLATLKQEYHEIFELDLDTSAYAIQNNSISNLLVQAGRLGMHQEFVHAGALATVNRDLHRRMRELIITGEVHSYEMEFPNSRRPPQLCYRLTDVLRVAQAERLHSGTEPLQAYVDNRMELTL
ncbi:hypothetical protein HYX12_03560, partial [Candidatus Woesearchaeota archaeon]|nr:hypothetical protein [Candidatus Woesearchaeota archaeon]